MGRKRRKAAEKVAHILRRLDHLQTLVGGEQSEPDPAIGGKRRRWIEEIGREATRPLAGQTARRTALRVQVDEHDPAYCRFGQIPGEMRGEGGLAYPEIGSASCGERVCAYV